VTTNLGLGVGVQRRDHGLGVGDLAATNPLDGGDLGRRRHVADGDAGVVRRVFVGDLVAARLDLRSIAVGGFLQTVSMRVTAEQLGAESSPKILGTE
jgi:hypothetical protein